MIFGPQFLHALLKAAATGGGGTGTGELTGNFTFDATSTIDENISGPSNSNWFVKEFNNSFYAMSASAGYSAVSSNGTTGWTQAGPNITWNAQYSEPIISFSNDSILWCTGPYLKSFDGSSVTNITTGKEGEQLYSIHKDATYYYLRTGNGIYRSTSLTTGWISVWSAGGQGSLEGGLRFNDNVTFIFDKSYLWRSTDGGASFTRVTDGLSGLDYNPTDGYWMKMDWVTNGSASYSISQDDGATWTSYIPIDQDGSGNQPIDRARELKYIGGDKWLMLSDDNDAALKGLYSVTSPKLTYDGFYQGWTKEFSLTGAARKMSVENYDTLFITELGTVIGTNTQTIIHKFNLERAASTPTGYAYVSGTLGTQPALGSVGTVTGTNFPLPVGYHYGSNYTSATQFDWITLNSPSFEEAKRIYEDGIAVNGGTWQYNYIDITFLDELQIGTILYATNTITNSNYNTFSADLAANYLRNAWSVGDSPAEQEKYIIRYPNYGTDGNGNAWWIGIDSTTSVITDIIEESAFTSLITKEFNLSQNAAVVVDPLNPTQEELKSIESLNLGTSYTSAQDILTEKHLLWDRAYNDPYNSRWPELNITDGSWYGFIKQPYFTDAGITEINWSGWFKSRSTKTPNATGSTGKEIAQIIANSDYIDRATFEATNFFPVFTKKSTVYPIINISSNTNQAIDLENTLPRVGTTRYELGYAWSDDGNKIALATGDNAGSKVYWANVGDSTWTDIGIPTGRYFASGLRSQLAWEGNIIYICIPQKYIYSYDTIAATGWIEDDGTAAITSAGYSGFFTDLDWYAINRMKIANGTYIWAGIGVRNSTTLNVAYGSTLTEMQEEIVRARAGVQTNNPVGTLTYNLNNGVYILENVGNRIYAHHNGSTIDITIGDSAWSNSFGTYRHVCGKSDGSQLMISANTSVYQYTTDGINFVQYTPNVANLPWYSGSEGWECVYDQINDIWFLVTKNYVSQEPGGKVIYTKTPTDVNSWKICHLNRSSYVGDAFENTICKFRY